MGVLSVLYRAIENLMNGLLIDEEQNVNDKKKLLIDSMFYDRQLGSMEFRVPRVCKIRSLSLMPHIYFS